MSRRFCETWVAAAHTFPGRYDTRAIQPTPISQIFNLPSTICNRMDTSRIAELLQPFLADAVLSASQLKYISTYIDILIRWNARMNLTAVRQPEEIITRHFGESLFAARHLLPTDLEHNPTLRVADLGSGAGFPGLPIRIWAPDVRLTLIESNQRKAVFLREVTRALTLTNVDVFAGRAEDLPAAQAGFVTLRAVERFDAALPVAARLVARSGRLALLISQAQADRAITLTTGFRWAQPVPIPLSSRRILLVGSLPDELSG
jgi:16S rRNA (guanine527-N7)-methyltransferase